MGSKPRATTEPKPAKVLLETDKSYWGKIRIVSKPACGTSTLREFVFEGASQDALGNPIWVHQHTWRANPDRPSDCLSCNDTVEKRLLYAVLIHLDKRK